MVMNATPPSLSLHLIAEQTWYGMECPFGQLGSLSWMHPLPGFSHPQPPGEGMLERNPQYFVSTAQQEPNQWGVISSFQVPKQSTALWGLLWGK